MPDEPPIPPRWQVFGERTLYDNPWVHLVQVDVEPPNGNRFWHHVVRLQTVALAVVIDEQDRVLLMYRHRFVPDAFGWELPGGILDAGEDGATAALREVEEETGWRPTGAPSLLIRFEPMPGMVETPHEVYVMRGAKYIGEPTDLEESARIAWIPLADVSKLIQDDQVAGSGSLVGLLHVLALGRPQG
jgi:8-oxo-dGTP pyrophosphatase MutT (NUDIX family)